MSQRCRPLADTGPDYDWSEQQTSTLARISWRRIDQWLSESDVILRLS